MTGVKGKTGTHKNRSNQWLAGSASRIRTDEVFSFKPKIEVIEAVKSDIEQRGITKTEWLDMAVESMLSIEESTESGEKSAGLPEIAREAISHGLVRDAIATAIQLKEAAISREKKAKRPDEGAIAKWQSEIEELEALL